MLINEEQVGFRSGYSTTDHLFTLNFIIDWNVNHGKRLYCAFVDYKKAFDCIYIQLSFEKKVLSYKINGKLFQVKEKAYVQMPSHM